MFSVRLDRQLWQACLKGMINPLWFWAQEKLIPDNLWGIPFLLVYKWTKILITKPQNICIKNKIRGQYALAHMVGWPWLGATLSVSLFSFSLPSKQEKKWDGKQPVGWDKVVYWSKAKGCMQAKEKDFILYLPAATDIWPFPGRQGFSTCKCCIFCFPSHQDDTRLHKSNHMLAVLIVSIKQRTVGMNKSWIHIIKPEKGRCIPSSSPQNSSPSMAKPSM